jgi:hypothetical protein
MPYQEKLNSLNSAHTDTLRVYNNISRLRLITFCGAAAAFFLIFYLKNSLPGILALTSFFILFIMLIIKHEKISQKKDKQELLIQINTQSLERAQDKWITFKDTGEEFIDKDHPYSNDLDIFGKASLFQWINVCNTLAGRYFLKELLSNPYKSRDKIIKNQLAIKELASKLEWRQNFQAEGLKLKEEKGKAESIKHIIEDDRNFINNKLPILFLRSLPVFLLVSILLYTPLETIPKAIPFILFLFQIIISLVYQRKISKNFSLIAKYRAIIKLYNRLLNCIEQEHFDSQYLIDLKNKLKDKDNHSAHLQIKKLETLADLINLRHSSIHPVINFLTLWDIHCLISFAKWKRNSGKKLETWINTIAEFEALASLSIINHDNQEWTLPKISKKTNDYLLHAKNLGHPLIDKKNRVCNDFTSNQKGSITVITGSNMSGKSTFLRTIAFNLVLSYLGTATCATEFSCSIFKIYTSMRISDNLDKNISSFYAELLRIKMILEAASKNKKTLFLLDEVFRGTNSKDRILGAREVLKHLSTKNTTGFVSTHDIELSELETNQQLKIKNFHFKESYKNNKIYFDYKLRDNVCNTSDAIYLMKMVGIEINTN